VQRGGVRGNYVQKRVAGVRGTTIFAINSWQEPKENAGEEKNVPRADGAYAWDAYLGADGGAQEGKRSGVRSSVSDRDDSAPRRRFDHGERFVRYSRRRTGR